MDPGRGRLRRSGGIRPPPVLLIPQSVAWNKDAATNIDPDGRGVPLASGWTVSYDYHVVSSGIQLDWDKVPGMAEAIESPAASGNYRYDLAPKTWNMIKNLTSGTAVFTQPSGPIKCAGAPRKIACLAADCSRSQGVLEDIRVVIVLPTPGMFGVKAFSDELERVVADYGIEVRFNSEMVEVDPSSRTGVIADSERGPGDRCTTTSCTPCRRSRPLTGSSAHRWPVLPTLPGTWRWTIPLCNTWATAKFLPWVTPNPHRTQKPGRLSESRFRCC
ncbi:NAD(P)/FAD-dependent oxidoreductase [Arthrobacter glacialis]|uniref:NAD(P)/FAD-dependent oxidoreductase n=1 Tax=Arthrobacter glacialis TaxID=1664 RepID=UPI001FAF1641|nr:FAD/NAD(P)-binding oxidoreductase [Arthrobacter glacialis]